MYSQSSDSESSVASLQGPGSCSESAFTDQYECVRAIGRGAYGQVILARHRLTGAEVAVKVLELVLENIPVFSEPNVLRTLEHPNVVQLFQVIGTEKHLYMVMEHAGGGRLLERIARGMQEEEARRVFRQMVCGVGYCHDQGIVHRDLKPENIMLDARGTVKIIDFGAATRFRAGQKLRRFWGTLPYLAPEAVEREQYEGPPADVWSLGVILFYMLTQSLPFVATIPERLLMRIALVRYDIPHHVPAQAQRLIHTILTFKPKRRPAVKQLFQHPWLKQGEEEGPHLGREALPKHPDPEVMALLVDLGLDPYQAWVSVAQRKCDAAMATYLIVQQQRSQGLGCVFPRKPVPPRVLPRFPVLRRKSKSEPALRTFPWPWELPEEAKEPGQEDLRRASLPAIPLGVLPAGAPAPGTASQSASVSYLPKRWRVLLRLLGRGHRKSSQDSSPDHRKGWAGRIATCVRRLCCCLPGVSNAVAPMAERRQEPDCRHCGHEEAQS